MAVGPGTLPTFFPVAGVRLGPGPRKIGMGFDVPGLGTLRFDFTDLVADE